jgi:hypothetical protein
MSKETRKAVLNARHKIEIESLNRVDAIQTRYSETVATARQVRKDEIAALKIEERNELRDLILNVNAEALIMKNEEHKKALNASSGQGTLTDATETKSPDKTANKKV